MGVVRFFHLARPKKTKSRDPSCQLRKSTGQHLLVCPTQPLGATLARNGRGVLPTDTDMHDGDN